MTTIKVGWFGFDAPQTNVAEVAVSGDGIEIRGRLAAPTGRDLDGLRAQLVGLADQPDTPVPVTIDSVPDLNGWYFVTGVDVDLPKGATQIGYWPFRLSLSRTPGAKVQPLEARILGLLRPNFQSKTSCVGWHAVPAGSTGYGGPAALAVPTVRQTQDGPVRIYTAGTDGLLNDFASWRSPAETALVGGARILSGQVESAPTSVFLLTGGSQSYTVPTGVTRLRVDVRGAAGGGKFGGRGARVLCEVAVTAGETLTVLVGGTAGQGLTGYNGGGQGGVSATPALSGYGGGGRSQIRRSSTDLVVAGGGGGQGGFDGKYARARRGGHAGPNGQPGQSSLSGRGGTATAGGAAGKPWDPVGGGTGTAGSAGTGGTGHVYGVSGTAGGGGGGGLWGGAGGSGTGFPSDAAGSGGGGSSKSTGISDSIITGYQAGNGEVIITPITAELAIDRATVTGVTASESPFGWQLSNGIISITPVYRGDAFMLDVSAWNGERWSTAARRWQLTDSGITSTPAAATLTGWTILRNTPERCVIRVTLESGAKAVQIAVTITLRRGACLADIRLDATEARKWGWGFVGLSNASNVTGGGLVETSADTDGNKYMMTTNYLASQQTSLGVGWYVTVANVTNFAVGLGALPAGITHTAADLLNQWYATATETIRAVNL